MRAVGRPAAECVGPTGVSSAATSGAAKTHLAPHLARSTNTVSPALACPRSTRALGCAPPPAARGRLPACESPEEPCWYCDPPAPQARTEMRLRSGLTCGQSAGPRRSASVRQACRGRPRQGAAKPHLARHWARSPHTVSPPLTCPRSTGAPGAHINLSIVLAECGDGAVSRGDRRCQPERTAKPT